MYIPYSLDKRALCSVGALTSELLRRDIEDTVDCKYEWLELLGIPS